jgi:ABC-type spermidine/putrescine transport system permease subunit II
MQRHKCLYIRHFELIRHPFVRSFEISKVRTVGTNPFASKWLVLARPQVAGFERPVTECDDIRFSVVICLVTTLVGVVLGFILAYGLWDKYV